MKLLAIRHGGEAFGIAGDEFLREAPWVLDKDRETVQQDSWLHFCDSFEDYLADGRERAVRVAEQAKAEREREKVRQAEAVVYRRQMRWNEYLRIAGVQPWPGISEEDGKFIALVAAEKAAAEEPQDIGEECYQQSLAVFRRWKFYKTDELLLEKQKLYDKLTQCAAGASQFEAKSQLEYVRTIKEFKDWVDREKNVESLRNESYGLDYLYQDLDPSQPAFDPDAVPF
jgi:hypothetical protein